jgi:hypothetical protein
VNYESEAIYKKAVVAYSTHYPGVCLEALRNTTRSRSQDSQGPGRDLNRGLSEYKYSLLPLESHVIFRCVVLKSVHGQLCLYVGFEVLTAVFTYSPLKVNRCFGGICRLHLQGRIIRQAKKTSAKAGGSAFHPLLRWFLSWLILRP